MGPLTVSSERVRDLGGAVGLALHLCDAELIAVSAVLTSELNSPRFRAVFETIRASVSAGIPHLIMLDSESHASAAGVLSVAGAIVISIDHDTEGGLARPFVIAAQLIDEFAASSVLMVKFEGEKPLFAEGKNISEIIDAGELYDICIGERSAQTWNSMPPYQVATELWLGLGIGSILGISNDTPSGVIILNKVGRQVFQQETVENTWSYLFVTPYAGIGRDLRVGNVTVDFRYHDAVVKEEAGSPAFDGKRRMQFDLMLARALTVVDGAIESDSIKGIVETLRHYRDCLERLAT